MGKENTSESYKYAFLEFTNEEDCVKAKNKLATTRFKGSELYVDFVGEKSKSAKTGHTVKKNPCRLFVCGLAPGMKKTTLREMFPKACAADIPSRSKEKGTSFGFVQFSNPGDAKAAFDAAQDLDMAGHKITVFYAKVSENKEEVIEKKRLKRKKEDEKRKAKKLKKANEAKEAESSDEEDDDDKEVTVNHDKSVVMNDTADTVQEDDEENDDDDDDEADADDGSDDEAADDSD